MKDFIVIYKNLKSDNELDVKVFVLFFVQYFLFCVFIIKYLFICFKRRDIPNQKKKKDGM